MLTVQRLKEIVSLAVSASCKLHILYTRGAGTWAHVKDLQSPVEYGPKPNQTLVMLDPMLETLEFEGDEIAARFWDKNGRIGPDMSFFSWKLPAAAVIEISVTHRFPQIARFEFTDS